MSEILFYKDLKDYVQQFDKNLYQIEITNNQYIVKFDKFSLVCDINFLDTHQFKYYFSKDVDAKSGITFNTINELRKFIESSISHNHIKI